MRSLTSTGELHRWMRQVGHDGRLLKSTSNRWRFLAWIHRRGEVHGCGASTRKAS